MDEEMAKAAVNFLKVDPAELEKRRGSFAGPPQFVYGMMVERDEDITWEMAAIVWGDGAFLFGERIETTPDGLEFAYHLTGYYQHRKTYEMGQDDPVTIPMSAKNTSRIDAAIRTWETVFEFDRPDDDDLVYRIRDASGWDPLGSGERIKPGPHLDLLFQVLRAIPFG